LRAAASVVLATAYCVWSRSLKSRLPIASSFQQVEPWAGMMKPWSLSTWNRPDNFLGAVLVSYRALCRAPTAGVTDGLEQQSRRARRTCRFNTPTVPPFNETRDLHWFNTIEVIPCVTVPQGCAQVDRVGRICIVGLRFGSSRTVSGWSVTAPRGRVSSPIRIVVPGTIASDGLPCRAAHLLCFP